jgi:hypothetical protein
MDTPNKVFAKNLQGPVELKNHNLTNPKRPANSRVTHKIIKRE